MPHVLLCLPTAIGVKETCSLRSEPIWDRRRSALFWNRFRTVLMERFLAMESCSIGETSACNFHAPTMLVHPATPMGVGGGGWRMRIILNSAKGKRRLKPMPVRLRWRVLTLSITGIHRSRLRSPRVQWHQLRACRSSPKSLQPPSWRYSQVCRARFCLDLVGLVRRRDCLRNTFLADHSSLSSKQWIG